MKAAGYCRISDDDQLEGRGVARQEQDVRAVCDRHGWDLVEVLIDNDVSASRYSRKPRPGYAKLLTLAGAGAIQRAVVYDLDRLLRRPRELEDLIDLTESLPGFEVHSLSGMVDLTTSAGRFTARTLVSKGAMESDDISRRTRRANDARAAEGTPARNSRAFGYEPDGKTIRENEAELLRQAVTDLLAGESLTAIARRWNALGVRTPQSGSEWGTTTVRVVLSGPRQAGLRVHRGEVVGPGTWDPIVSRDDHERVKRVLASRTRGTRPPRRTPFTGLYYFAETGAALKRDVVRGKPVYRCYRKPGAETTGFVSVQAQPLEDLTVAWLLSRVEDGDLARTRAAKRAQRPTDVPDIGGIEADLRALAEDHGEGRLPRAEWLAARKPLEARLVAAQRLLGDTDRAEVLVDVGAGLAERWPGYSVDRQREILLAVFDRILIHKARRLGPGFDPSRVEPIWRD